MTTLRGRRVRDQRKEPEPAPRERRLLTPRTGLILLYALVSAATIGGLTFAVQRHLAAAALAGISAFAAAVIFVDRVIGTRWE